MSEQTKKMIFFAVVGLLLWQAMQGGSSPVENKPTAVTYVYEKDETAVPAPVKAAINTLNKQGIVATLFEDDTVDGTGETPEQYKVPLAAAKEATLPALVVTAGSKVIRVVKNPKTEAEVLEAAK